MRSDPRGLADRAFSTAVTLLLAALALYVAVRLVLSVWVALVVIVAVVGALTLAVAIWRSYRSRW